MHLIKQALLPLLILLASTQAGLAHHGGASTSQGPGTPIETSSPLSLPKGATVVFTRFELANFRKFGAFQPSNIDSFQFMQLGVSHGLTNFLSATVILPYNIKTQDTFGSSRGVGDAKFLLNLGFNYSGSDGFQLNDEDDTVVNLAENHKTFLGLTGGFSVPSGRNNIDLGEGVNGAMQPGFGSPTFSLGLSMTRALSPRFTIAADTGVDIFSRRANDDRYATEFRANVAGVYEAYADKEAFVKRVDTILELNYLHVGRDLGAGIPELGTGGNILYLTPGVRMQVADFSVGAAVKIPIVKSVNEVDMQQGAEGLEKYRLLFTVSRSF